MELPTFSKPLIIPDPEENAITWYLHGIAAYSGMPAEPLSAEDAEAQVRDGYGILAPHFYSLKRRDGDIEFYVPDCGGEHRRNTAEDATQTLRRVIADHLG